ncbi:unnamed protein product, partial [Amoebophrya sp. A120]|eukprot:GSA120T00015193001.1
MQMGRLRQLEASTTRLVTMLDRGIFSAYAQGVDLRREFQLRTLNPYEFFRCITLAFERLRGSARYLKPYLRHSKSDQEARARLCKILERNYSTRTTAAGAAAATQSDEANAGMDGIKENANPATGTAGNENSTDAAHAPGGTGQVGGKVNGVLDARVLT